MFLHLSDAVDLLGRGQYYTINLINRPTKLMPLNGHFGTMFTLHIAGLRQWTLTNILIASLVTAVLINLSSEGVKPIIQLDKV